VTSEGCGAVDLAGAGDLEGHQPAEAGVDDAGLQLLDRHPEGVEVLLWQVDPVALQVLPDVAQEVRELKGDAEVGGVGGRDGERHDRLEHREHLQPDDRG
jgi:hypothetical protein